MMCLVILLHDLVRLVDIHRRLAVFGREMEEEWVRVGKKRGGGNQRLGEEERRLRYTKEVTKELIKEQEKEEEEEEEEEEERGERNCDSLYNFSCHVTNSVDQAVLELRDPPLPPKCWD
jgi:hypothetical protein